nr:hypothetical protein Q903MT_gene5212 [Picea sitchensis]
MDDETIKGSDLVHHCLHNCWVNRRRRIYRVNYKPIGQSITRKCTLNEHVLTMRNLPNP